MLGIDVGFILAVAVVGFGLSLATYRVFARHCGWPVGSWQAAARDPDPFGRAVACGLAVLFALARGYGGYVVSAWAIPVFGMAWAVFWTGFLRVGAQSALLLAPVAAALLMVWWLS